MAWYNEKEQTPGLWLARLVQGGHLPAGDVVIKDMLDLRPGDVPSNGQAHFFAGIGGWALALRLAGVPDTANVWTGSCPCQPFSRAGNKRGFDDDRHLWPHWFSLIQKHEPPVVLGEQVGDLAGRTWFDAVSADLEGAGYAVAAADLCAASVGAPHVRQRLYFAAIKGWMGNANRRYCDWLKREVLGPEWKEGSSTWSPDHVASAWSDPTWVRCSDGTRRPSESGTFPLAHGVPSRMGRLRAYGNAIVPQVAAFFIRAALGLDKV